MLTIVLQTPATMALPVLTETAGTCVTVRLVSLDQFVKSTSTSVTRHRAAMEQHVEIKSTVLNASVPPENSEHVAKVRMVITCDHSKQRAMIKKPGQFLCCVLTLYKTWQDTRGYHVYS